MNVVKSHQTREEEGRRRGGGGTYSRGRRRGKESVGVDGTHCTDTEVLTVLAAKVGR